MIQDEIEQLIKPIIEQMGYVLWGCEYLSQGKHSLLRIYIDKESGIGLGDCEHVSRDISAILDVENTISENYSLEVSSPGIPRPIFYNWQYLKYIGHTVQIKLIRPVSGTRKFMGTLESADENTIVLKLNDESQEFIISNIVKANLTGE